MEVSDPSAGHNALTTTSASFEVPLPVMIKSVSHRPFVVKKVCNCGCRSSIQSSISSGWIWSKNSLGAENWLLDVKLRVTGRGRVGADGMVTDSYPSVAMLVLSPRLFGSQKVQVLKVRSSVQMTTGKAWVSSSIRSTTMPW